MSRIGNLVNDFCPGGVSWSTLGNISCRVSSGGTPTSDNTDFYGGDIPWLRTQEVDFGEIFETGVHITEVGLNGSSAKWIPENCVIVAMYGATAAKVAINKIPLTTNQACCNLEIDPARADHRYVFHWIASRYEHLRSLGEGSQSNLNARKVKDFEIPVPPIEVQREIVQVLDEFGYLEDELKAELELRKRQYGHYLSTLTNPFRTGNRLKQGWTTSRLGELCRLEKGATPIQKAIAGDYPLVATALERRSSSSFQFDAEAVCVPLISSKGHGVASISRIYYQSGKFALGNILCAAIPNDPSKLSAEFLFHYLQARKDFLLVPLMRGGANVSLTMDSLKSVTMHFPSLEEQRRINESLRVLGSLIDDDVCGLPVEIAVRRKQYEYYRDKLLTFEEVTV